MVNIHQNAPRLGRFGSRSKARPRTDPCNIWLRRSEYGFSATEGALSVPAPPDLRERDLTTAQTEITSTTITIAMKSFITENRKLP